MGYSQLCFSTGLRAIGICGLQLPIADMMRGQEPQRLAFWNLTSTWIHHIPPRCHLLTLITMAHNNRLSIFQRHTPHRPSPLRYFTPLSSSPPPQEAVSESSNFGGSEPSNEQTTSDRGELENHDDSEKGGSGDDSGPADGGSKIIAGNLVHMGAIIINKRELRTVKIIKE